MGVLSNVAAEAATIVSPAAFSADLPGSLFALAAPDVLALLGVICALIPAGLALRCELRRRTGPRTVYRFPAELAPGTERRAVEVP